MPFAYTYAAPLGFSFTSQPGIKVHSKNSSPNKPPRLGSPISATKTTYRSHSVTDVQEVKTLLGDLADTKRVLKDSKKAIINELPIFKESLKQEVQTMMLYFIDGLKQAQENHSNQLYSTMEALRAQIGEKEVMNMNLMDANKALAQRNESLSVMLYNASNDVSRIHHRDSSPGANIDPDSSYVKAHSKKLLYESKTMSNHIDYFSTNSPYSLARIKAQMQSSKDAGKFKSQREKLN
ncbi:Hypothetical predicted protein [Olea europaea subsp. europaea]|uniref:Uncharacterized protein n=1 Tax=Olea europaea subsp. europaea TaxID=158383 RepID=A0A8S0SD64_OLEEU|nr:Hypothetical predicted protein [Olea europaea subsp. europaea]